MSASETSEKIRNAIAIFDKRSKPLWVVNGVVKGKDFDHSYLNPDDIVYVDILKGPNTVALYGKDAEDGVILITMKER